MKDSNSRIIRFLNNCDYRGNVKLADGLHNKVFSVDMYNYNALAGGLSERWTGDRYSARIGLVRQLRHTNADIREIKECLKGHGYEERVASFRSKELEANKIELADGRRMTTEEFREYRKINDPAGPHPLNCEEYVAYNARVREIKATYPTKDELRCELARQKCRARIYTWALELFDGTINEVELSERFIRVSKKKGWVNGSTAWYNLLRYQLATLVV